MLTCHACMKRCLQTLIGESYLVATSSGSAIATNRSRRNYSSGTVQQTSPSRHHKPTEGKPNFTSHKPENGFKRDTVSTSYKRQEWLESRGLTPPHKRVERATDDLLMKKQLKYLKDPLKLAEHVRKVLREDDFESALALVRAASKDTQCIVSWNHLIDWQLSRQKMNGAIKTYNEMKKRAQAPDAYTYTIIFRGCAEHPMTDAALGKVITIYNSMLAQNSPVKPNTIHLNAVLKMCSNAQNMDALFSMIDQLPAKGLRAPNNLTYTIILNAIRLNAFASLRGDLTPVQQRQNRQKANLDARLLWQDITKRWFQGDIVVDEELVCTMGRIMLLGTEEDIDDILSLIEQTMNVPRQIPRRGIQRGHEMDQKQREQLQARDSHSIPSIYVGQASSPIMSPTELPLAVRSTKNEAEAGIIQTMLDVPPASEPASSGSNLSASVSDPFKAQALPKNLTKKFSLFPKPGQNTLSLIMSALIDLDRQKSKGTATKYWNILTNDYQVEPDADNYHGYLRILRVARASTETVQLLLQMPLSYMEIKTFRISMSTCARDKNNRQSFSNAGKVLDLMQTQLSVPDFQVLDAYLDIACSATACSEKVSSNCQLPVSKTAKGKQILRALSRLNPSYTNLRSLLAYGDPTKSKATPAEQAALTDAVLGLTKRMVRSYDLLMNNAMVERTIYSELMKERSKLAAFITRFKGQKNGTVRPTISRDIANESDRFLHRIKRPYLVHLLHSTRGEVSDSSDEEERVRR